MASSEDKITREEQVVLADSNGGTPIELPPFEDLNYDVTISKEADDLFVAEIKDLPGCLAQGKSLAEVWESIQEAKQLWIETAQEINRPIPSQCRGVFQVRILPPLHAILCKIASYQQLSLNKLVNNIINSEYISVKDVGSLSGLKLGSLSKNQAALDEAIYYLSKTVEEDEYSGRFTVRMPSDCHRKLAKEARRNKVSLNSYLVTLFERYAGHILASTPLSKNIKHQWEDAQAKRDEKYRRQLSVELNRLHHLGSKNEYLFYKQLSSLDLPINRVVNFLRLLNETIERDSSESRSYSQDLAAFHPSTSSPEWRDRAEGILSVFKSFPDTPFDIPNFSNLYERLSTSVARYKSSVFEYYKSQKDRILPVSSFKDPDPKNIKINLRSYNELVSHCLVIGDADLLYVCGLEKLFGRSRKIDHIPDKVLLQYQDAFQTSVENSQNLMSAVYFTILRDSFRDFQDKEYLSYVSNFGYRGGFRDSFYRDSFSGSGSTYFEDLSVGRFFPNS